MSITVPASANVLEISTTATPVAWCSRQDALAAQPIPSADNIVWGTSAADDIAGDAPEGDNNVIWQTPFDGDSSSAGSVSSPSF
jgi:hypothetical protein